VIEIGFPVQIFRGLVLGLALGDEIGVIIQEDGIVAASKSPGIMSAGIMKINKEGLLEFRYEGETLPYQFTLNLMRSLSFAKACQEKKGASVKIKIEGGNIRYSYTGDRYKYMVEPMMEADPTLPDFIAQIKQIIEEVMKDSLVVSVPTKNLRASLQDTRKYIKSGDVSFVVDGDRVLFEGADELVKFGFGLTTASSVGKKERVVTTVGMDVIRDVIEAAEEAGETANIFITPDKPIVIQVPMPSGEVLYAVAVRAKE